MFQHIANDEGQILLRHDFLLVAQFGDALSDTFGLLWRQFQSQFLQVLGNVRPSTVLTQGILPFPAKPLRHQFVLIESVFLVPVGMHTSHLRKHIVADNRLIGRHSNTTITLHQS